MLIKDLSSWKYPISYICNHSQELSRHIGIISNPRQLYSFLFFFSLTLPTPIHYMYIMVHGVLAVRSSRPWDKGLGPGVKKIFFQVSVWSKNKGGGLPWISHCNVLYGLHISILYKFKALIKNRGTKQNNKARHYFSKPRIINFYWSI